MPVDDLDDSQVSDAIRDTEALLERRLLVDLESAKAQGWRAEEQLSRYSELEESVRGLDAQGAACLRVHTELGTGVLVEAEVPDTSRLYVDVGLGFHVELQRAEALQVATERQAVAQEQLRGAKQTLQKVQSAVWQAQQGLLDLRQSLRWQRSSSAHTWVELAHTEELHERLSGVLL